MPPLTSTKKQAPPGDNSSCLKISHVCGMNCPLKVPVYVFPSPREERADKACSRHTTSGETKLGDMFVHAGKVQNTREST